MARNSLDYDIKQGVLSVGHAMELCQLKRKRLKYLCAAGELNHMPVGDSREVRIAADSLLLYCTTHNIFNDKRLAIAADNYRKNYGVSNDTSTRTVSTQQSTH